MILDDYLWILMIFDDIWKILKKKVDLVCTRLDLYTMCPCQLAIFSDPTKCIKRRKMIDKER